MAAPKSSSEILSGGAAAAPATSYTGASSAVEAPESHGSGPELSDLTSYWYRNARPERPIPGPHIEEVWREVWFAKGAQQVLMDKDLLRFAGLLESVADRVDAGSWRPETLLEKIGCILLFDQVPRNIFRGSPKAYAYDRLAYPIATALHDNTEQFRSLPLHLRYTVIICIVHSELLADQDKVVAFAESLPSDTLGLTFRAIGAFSRSLAAGFSQPEPARDTELTAAPFALLPPRPPPSRCRA